MDVPARFVELVGGPEDQVALDEAMLLIAAGAEPDLDVTTGLQRLDALADGCFAPTLQALVRYLFVDLGFAGNREDYYDPRNSFLNHVLDRRRGIPISLSVLAIVVGRRIGVPLAGVGMPGHFLLRDRLDPDVFVDPFARGVLLDRAGCERAFRTAHGPAAPFDPSFLDPVGSRAILGRVLANLKGIYRDRGDRPSLAWVLRMRAAIPGVPDDERRQLASVLAADGQFAAAARELEHLAAQSGGDTAEDDLASATRMRARLN